MLQESSGDDTLFTHERIGFETLTVVQQESSLTLEMHIANAQPKGKGFMGLASMRMALERPGQPLGTMGQAGYQTSAPSALYPRVAR
jgi:hypothetical protein